MGPHAVERPANSVVLVYTREDDRGGGAACAFAERIWLRLGHVIYRLSALIMGWAGRSAGMGSIPRGGRDSSTQECRA